MAEPSAPIVKRDSAAEPEQVAAMLGGARLLRRQVRSPLEAHELLLRGLPPKALDHLIGNLVVLRKNASLGRAIGMSVRTFQRRKEVPARPLSPEQSGKTWHFAGILAKATQVFGTQKAAEEWLEQPATGLDQRRPIDLLATPAGVELVDEFLERLRYGVYA